MSPEEIITKLKANKEKIRNRIFFTKSLDSNNLFNNLAKDIEIAKKTIGVNDHDFHAYVIARLSGKI